MKHIRSIAENLVVGRSAPMADVSGSGISRLNFIRGVLSALGFGAMGGGRIFAAPPGWKPAGTPNLVFGAISDTHLRTAADGMRMGAKWRDTWFTAGVNMGIGHETNGGVTTLLIPIEELPKDENLVFTVTPLSSLGTRGRSISQFLKPTKQEPIKK